jgi:anti-sigma regulatory factor (Ser/Thr protein kinase)
VSQAGETLHIRPELAELQRAQAWLEAIGEQFELGAATLYALSLCCEEAVSNIIRHGLPPGGLSGQTIELTLWREADLLHLRMVDPGAAFDPTAVPDASLPASLEEARVGGLGVHLMRKFSQALHYERRDAKNVLTLDFSLSPAPTRQPATPARG